MGACKLSVPDGEDILPMHLSRVTPRTIAPDHAADTMIPSGRSGRKQKSRMACLHLLDQAVYIRITRRDATLIGHEEISRVHLLELQFSGLGIGVIPYRKMHVDQALSQIYGVMGIVFHS
ncbi:MAG TPA: hypothetical protein VNQ97_00305, partial [Burkholderiaceae bacterium]|nr:hypothetical protein [Burkholderiaceae bacterium]